MRAKARVPKGANRFLLRPRTLAGEVVVRASRLVRIEARLDEGRGGVKALATGETDEASSATLRARSSIDGTCIDGDFDVLRSRETGCGRGFERTQRGHGGVHDRRYDAADAAERTAGRVDDSAESARRQRHAHRSARRGMGFLAAIEALR